MSKKATESQRKSMSLMYRGTGIFHPLNTGWKKRIVPTLWFLGAVIAAYNAWNYYQDGNMGFVYVQILIFLLFLIHAIRGYIKIRKEENNK